MSKTVLVVDDDQDLQDAVVELLRARGYDARGADHGVAGLESVERQLPNVVLLDMHMPVMNGWEFARILRERHERRVPIVVVTAAVDACRTATEIHAEGWLNKPFHSDDLFAAVQRHIGEP